MLAPWKESHDQPAAAAKSVQSCPSLRPHGLQPTRLLRPWDFPARGLEWVPSPSPLFLLDCAYSANTEDLFCARRCCRHGKYGSMQQQQNNIGTPSFPFFALLPPPPWSSQSRSGVANQNDLRDQAGNVSE